MMAEVINFIPSRENLILGQIVVYSLKIYIFFLAGKCQCLHLSTRLQLITELQFCQFQQKLKNYLICRGGGMFPHLVSNSAHGFCIPSLVQLIFNFVLKITGGKLVSSVLFLSLEVCCNYSRLPLWFTGSSLQDITVVVSPGRVGIVSQFTPTPANEVCLLIPGRNCHFVSSQAAIREIQDTAEKSCVLRRLTNPATLLFSSVCLLYEKSDCFFHVVIYACVFSLPPPSLVPFFFFCWYSVPSGLARCQCLTGTASSSQVSGLELSWDH